MNQTAEAIAEFKIFKTEPNHDRANRGNSQGENTHKTVVSDQPSPGTTAFQLMATSESSRSMNINNVTT